MSGERTWTPEELEAWVVRSCAEQGVPVKVTDPLTLRRVATLFLGYTPPHLDPQA